MHKVGGREGGENIIMDVQTFTASLNYKNTMINIITMETVACLRS
jgi:hypothetical protein